ncbi:MAG: hypothetical protein ACRDJH_14670 [Thermomicrobiales bacterium]
MTDGLDRWPARLAEVKQDLRRWRRAHPDATLTEIEAALDRRLRAVRAGLLTDLAADAPAGPDRCPACDESLVRRGDRPRTLRTQGEQALTLARPDASCPACGTGLFPPR